MTTTGGSALPTQPASRTVRGPASPVASRLVLLLVVGVAGVAGFATAAAQGAQASAYADPDLARLLRAMAVLKALIASAAVSAVLWRLRTPVTLPRLAAYALAGAAMAAGPGLIWRMTHLGAGALLLHGGLLACALLLWRDPEVSRRLTEIVAARRAMPGTPGRATRSRPDR